MYCFYTEWEGGLGFRSHIYSTVQPLGTQGLGRGKRFDCFITKVAGERGEGRRGSRLQINLYEGLESFHDLRKFLLAAQPSNHPNHRINKTMKITMEWVFIHNVSLGNEISNIIQKLQTIDSFLLRSSICNKR